MQYIYQCEPDCKYCDNFNAPHIKRFFSYVNKTKTCWLYTGAKSKAGYGWFSYLGNPVYAHRFSISLIKELEVGKEIDHLCRNRLCVNPDHLEQVDHRTNMLRSPTAITAINHRKKKCVRGHSLISNRRCKKCTKDRLQDPIKRQKYNQYMKVYMQKRNTIKSLQNN